MSIMNLEQRSVMTTAEEVTMKYPHFRLKIDLSKFFHDARRFCWIFIDGMKVQHIIHIQQHISRMFNIREPFHLLLNDIEYLPPTEDVRILKENETILVVPGSGINNEIIVETSNNSVYDKQSQIANVNTAMVVQNVSNDTLNNMQPTSINNATKDMTFYSVINDTMIDHSKGDTDSKTTDNNNSFEDCNIMDSIVSVAKRKRTRKRRPKNRSQFVASLLNGINEEYKQNEPTSKKPKIIDSYIIPSDKHIRFDTEDENHIAKQIVQEVSRNESYLSKASSSKDLSALLALGHSSTPLTFIKKLKNGVRAEGISNDETNQNLNKITENSEKDSCSKEINKKVQNKNFRMDLEKIPVMTRKPQFNDIISFRTLKMGTDYTPQVSNTIISEVIGFCPKSTNYTLRIIDGREEIQVPFGKFSLSEDEFENHPDGDTFILNYTQMIEPRLIS
ncbi:uncharacterized protein LOC105430576 [Pogonomyrmex barbatus]|uniref:Uncharacterized protein LOC105430576 n=1 Tax=Pogonomyrmex barbatus TaxID=144034 RepID=A0A6I9WS41_9HYME|nr:uncharacterized protein LOC105430576 [Pogonomyrmex barbatus]